MHEFPHIFMEIKNLAIARNSRDQEMKLVAHQKILDEEKADKFLVVAGDGSDRTANHFEQVPYIEEFFEAAKDTYPLRDIIGDFVEDDFEKERLEADINEVEIEDIMSVGTEKVYNQLKGKKI